jgi:cysteine synthase
MPHRYKATHGNMAVEQFGRFWATPERYRTLRQGFRALCTALSRSPQWFHKHIKSVTEIGAMAPAPKTLNRFYDDGDAKTLSDYPLYQSGLLVTCYHLYKQHQDAIPPDNPPIMKLVALAQDHEAEFGRITAKRAAIVSTPTDPQYTRAQLQLIHDSIIVPTTNDPDNPEFPPNAPRFPATPMNQYKIGTRIILIKDESWNPTGSHKDRWAWEIIVRYKRIIADVLRNDDSIHIPHPSMISSGSAALALQSSLRLLGLPNLRVVMDSRRAKDHPGVIAKLQVIGAKIFLHDLDQKELSDEEVLAITENPKGIDLTARSLEEPFQRKYYDWLGYEILEACAKHIFVPVGTGELFANIILIINDEATRQANDPRLRMGARSITDVNVYGATTRDEKTRMDKLYAKFRPTLHEVENILNNFKESGTLGPESGIFNVSQESLLEAMNYARYHKIRTEHSGMAGLALFLEKANNIPPTESIVVVNTGLMYTPEVFR